jgi:hypothetical protein
MKLYQKSKIRIKRIKETKYWAAGKNKSVVTLESSISGKSYYTLQEYHPKSGAMIYYKLLIDY